MPSGTAEQSRNQAELQRLNRALETIVVCRRRMMQAQGEVQLLEEVCKVLVEQGGYRMAWVGHPLNDEAKQVKPVAFAGFFDGYLDGSNISWGDNEGGKGPVGVAIRSRQPAIFVDGHDSSLPSPWRARALQRGYASGIALPLLHGGVLFGVMAIYASTPNAFDKAEIELLTDLATDVAYGVRALRTGAESHKTAASAQLFELVANRSRDSILYMGFEDGRILEVNDAAVEAYGYTREEFRALSILDLRAPDTRAIAPVQMDVARTRGILFESVHQRRDGNTFPVEVSSRGAVVGGRNTLISVVRDITERRQAEAALRAAAVLREQILESVDEGIIVYDLDLRYRYWNRYMEELTGCKAADMIGLHPRGTFSFISSSGALAKLESVIAGGPPELFEIPYNLPTGRSGWTAIGMRALLNEAHEIVGAITTIREITGSKRAVDELRHSEAKFRAVVESSTVGITFCNADSVVVWRSQPNETITGYSNEERSGRPGWDIVHPDDQQAFRRQWEALLLQPGGDVSTEYRIQHKDGTVHWVFATWRNLLHNPDLAAIVVTTRDITARRRAADELSQSEAKFRAVVENIQEGIHFRDADNLIMWRSQPNASISGYSDEERLGRPVWEVIHPDDIEEYRRQWKELVRQPGAFDAAEYRIRGKDGGTRWIGSTFRNLLHNPHVGAVVVTTRDITARKTAEESVRNSEARFRAVVETSHDSIMLWDADGTLLWRSAAYLTGFPAAERLGHSIFDLAHPDHVSGLRDLWMEILKAPGQTRSMQYQLRRKDGVYRWVDVRFQNQLANPDVRAVVVNARDITDHKAADDALRTSEAKFRAVAETSHDCIMLWDAEGRITWRSADFHVGYTRDESIGIAVLDRIHPDDVACFRDAWAEMRQHPGEKVHLQHRVVQKDGSYRWSDMQLQNLLANPDVGAVVVNARDITEQKLAEEALVASETLHRTLFNSANDAVLLREVTPDGNPGRYITANRVAVELIGYTVEELRQMTPADIMAPSANAGVRSGWEKIRQEGHATFEVDFLTKDGRQIPIEVSTTRFEVGGKRLDLAIARDLTERRKADDDLRASLQRFSTITACVPETLWTMDFDGRLTYVSPNLVHTHGWTAEEGHNLHLRDLTSDEHQDWVPRLIAEELAKAASPDYDRSRILTEEVLLRRKNGETFWAEVRASILWSGDGKPEGLIGATRDITERKRAEESLRATTEQLVAITACVPEVIWATDLTGKFTFASPAVERMCGWTTEEMKSINREEMLLPEGMAETTRLVHDELSLAMSPGYDRTRVIAFDSEHRRKDGSTFTAEFTATLLWSDDGKPAGLIGVTRDVTARKQLEAERSKLADQLSQAQKMEAVGRLAGGVAHDFNNLLTVINGRAELVYDRLNLHDPMRSELDEIVKAGKRAAGLTSQLLAFSRKQILKSVSFDLNQLILEMERMLGRIVGEDVEVRLELSPQPCFVHADTHQFEQVIMNLSVNARDAMPTGGRLLIETSLVDRQGNADQSGAEAGVSRQILLTVRDAGTGMSRETVQNIFEPFFTTKETGKGTGLGLATVQGIIAQSSGSIEVESELGKGTAFHIYLPMAAASVAEAAPVASAPRMVGKGTVLVVEDQLDVLEIVVDVLETYGYTVLQAQSGDEALALCERETGEINLVLTDAIMPGMSGSTLLDQLKQIRPQTKVLLMSGYTDDVMVRHGVSQSKVAFIQKPFGPRELAAKVGAVLGAEA